MIWDLVFKVFCFFESPSNVLYRIWSETPAWENSRFSNIHMGKTRSFLWMKKNKKECFSNTRSPILFFWWQQMGASVLGSTPQPLHQSPWMVLRHTEHCKLPVWLWWTANRENLSQGSALLFFILSQCLHTKGTTEPFQGPLHVCKRRDRKTLNIANVNPTAQPTKPWQKRGQESLP